MGIVQDLLLYLTRPIIPFCFGLPLLLPAALLVAVAFMQDDISTTLHVLGILLLVLSVLSIAWGITLGVHDLYQSRKTVTRPVTRGFQRTNKPKSGTSGKLRNGVTKKSISPNLSVPSSVNSSRSSSVTSERSASHVVINEKVHMMPSKKSRRSLKKQIFRTKKVGMPALKEEDNVNAAASVAAEDSNTAGKGKGDIGRNSSAKAFQNLEKQLREIGLGSTSVPGTLTTTSVEVDSVPPLSFSRQNTEGAILVKQSNGVPLRAPSYGLKRSRSMPEHDLELSGAVMPQSPRGTGVPGGAREEEKLRRSARATHQFSEQPVLVGDSAERVGVRSDVGNIF